MMDFCWQPKANPLYNLKPMNNHSVTFIRLKSTDPLHKELQRFWHNLQGSIEFTLKNGRTYKLKAVTLPNKRGFVVTGQNVSGYFDRAQELENRFNHLQGKIERMKS